MRQDVPEVREGGPREGHLPQPLRHHAGGRPLQTEGRGGQLPAIAACGPFGAVNGLDAYDQRSEDGRFRDGYRIDYFRQHIAQMEKAIEDGVELLGYTPWGCIDLASLSTGEMAKRYGFIYVDKHDDGTGDLHREKKDSFDWYKKVCKSNGAELD